MNNKGFTLIELLIVIVVLGIISAFSTVLVSEIIENTRQSSFVVSADVFLDAATSSYQQSDPIWDDNIATLAEIIEAGYVDIGQKDPWNGEYNFIESYVIADITLGLTNEIYLSAIPFNQNSFTAVSNVTFRIKLVSTTAIIGFDDALEEFSEEDIVFLDGSSGSLVEQIISIFDNNLSDGLTTDDGNDEIDVTGDISGGSSVETLDGDDTLVIGDDIKNGSSVDMGAGDDILNLGDDIKDGSSVDMGEGDDTLNIDGEIKQGSTVETGDGNDVIVVNDDIQDNGTVLSTGAGDDTVTVNDKVKNGAVIDTGSGNDTVTLNGTFDDATVLTESGDDILNIDYMRDNATIDTGEDNDTINIRSVSSTYDGQTTLGPGDDTLTIIDSTGGSKDLQDTDGTFDGGPGDDTLNLPYITLSQWNSYVSVLFSNFETVVLQDTTINP